MDSALEKCLGDMSVELFAPNPFMQLLIDNPQHFRRKEERMEENDTAQALIAIANALDRLGLNDAATSMGAIEALSKEVRDGFRLLAASVDGLAEAIVTAATYER